MEEGPVRDFPQYNVITCEIAQRQRRTEFNKMLLRQARRVAQDIQDIRREIRFG